MNCQTHYKTLSVVRPGVPKNDLFSSDLFTQNLPELSTYWVNESLKKQTSKLFFFFHGW